LYLIEGSFEKRELVLATPGHSADFVNGSRRHSGFDFVVIVIIFTVTMLYEGEGSPQ
jgi:hypothetical protein